MKFSRIQQTGHPHFTGDVRNIHDLQLTYGLYATNGRHTERPRFTRLTYRTRQHNGRWSEHQEQTKHRPKTT